MCKKCAKMAKFAKNNEKIHFSIFRFTPNEKRKMKFEI